MLFTKHIFVFLSSKFLLFNLKLSWCASPFVYALCIFVVSHFVWFVFLSLWLSFYSWMFVSILLHSFWYFCGLHNTLFVFLSLQFQISMVCVTICLCFMLYTYLLFLILFSLYFWLSIYLCILLLIWSYSFQNQDNEQTQYIHFLAIW